MLPSELFQCENIPILHKYVEYKAILREIINFVTEIEFANFAKFLHEVWLLITICWTKYYLFKLGV